MTIIVDTEYKIIQNEYGFDLIKLTPAKRKGEGTIVEPTGEDYIREDIVGYYSDLERVIRKIIHLKLNDKSDVVSLKEYLKLYKQLYRDVCKLLGQEPLS